MSEIVRTPGEKITLHCFIRDTETPANNPIVGEDVRVSLRRMSDDYWWNFTSNIWENIVFGSLTDDHKQVMTDRDDGSYEWDFDQEVVDGGVAREYEALYQVVSVGDYLGRADTDHLVFSSGSGIGDNSVIITVVDEDTNIVAGALVYIKSSELGNPIYSAYTNTNGIAVFYLDDGNYWVKVNASNFGHSAEQITVSGDTNVTITLSSLFIPVASDDPDTLTIYDYVRDDAGVLVGIEDAKMWVERYKDPVWVEERMIHPVVTRENDSDANGLVQLICVREGEYRIRISTNRRTREYSGTVPSVEDYIGTSISLHDLATDFDWEYEDVSDQDESF